MAATTNATSSTPGFYDPFGGEGQSKLYSLYRPRYSPTLLKGIIDKIDMLGIKKDSLVDVACGTGQVVSQLAPHFTRALGIDRSASQLKESTPGPNITYQEGSCYELPLSDASTDVITVGQAMHWFELPRWFSEVDRVLVPGGALVVLGYGTCSLPRVAQAQEVFASYYDSLEQYWDCDRSMLATGFRKVDFSPLKVEGRLEEDIVEDMSIKSFIGYLRSWSPYRTLMHKQGLQGVDPLVEVERQLTAIVGAATNGGQQEPTITVSTPFYVVIARKER